MLDESVGRLKRLQADVAASLRDDTHSTNGPIAPREGLAQFVHFWSLVGRFFWRNRCQVRASALAYTTLMALVPLLAVSLTVASLVFDPSSEASRQKLTGIIERFVDNVAPSLGLSDAEIQGPMPPAPEDEGELATAAAARRATVADNILGFVSKIHFGTIGVTAMLGLIFVAISLLRTIEAAFNDIWGVAKGRGWFESIILYWAAISLGPIIMLVATTSGYLNALSEQSAGLQKIPGFTLLSSELVPLLVVGLGFGALYRVMPNTRVGWQAALLGGLVSAILWWLNNRLGVLYSTKVVTYSKIYGSLGAIPLFLLGLYFSWMIVLFGAQVSYVFQNRHAYLQERMAERVHHQAREFVALRFMAEIGRRFSLKIAPPSATLLSTSFAVPARLASQILESLAHAQLIVETAAPDSGYTPARPLEQIVVRDILKALRTGQGSDLPTTQDESRPVVQAEFAAILAAEESRSSRITLAELVQRLPIPT